MLNKWDGKNYHTLSYFLKNKFGEKVYRISIDAGFTCPNRDGSKGIGGCIYCNEEGSRASYVNPEKTIEEQIIEGIQIIKKRYNANKYIAYFQPYSNTYAKIEFLEEIYKKVLKFPEIVGISIGTRPDCIDEEKLKLLNDLSEYKFVIIEYGVQSMKNETLDIINRCHTINDTINAIKMTKKYKNIHLLTHIILGLPGENEKDMINTVNELTQLGIDAIKIHHLYVEKNTILEKLYNEGKVKVFEMEEYCNLLMKVIGILPENIVIHRLFGQCSTEKLIAPLWTLNKNIASNYLDNLLKNNQIYQGKYC